MKIEYFNMLLKILSFKHPVVFSCKRLKSTILALLLVAGNCHGFGFEDTLNEGSPCYDQMEDETDDLNKPLRCMPPFKNVIRFVVDILKTQN